jgi:hypothetical protein
VNKAGGNGQKQINLKALRQEDNRKPHQQKGGDRHAAKKQFKKGGKPQPHGQKKEGPASKEDLDREMENYWVKSGNTELGKISHPIVN